MDSELYMKIIEDCFPQIRILTCTAILEGWSSFVLEVNGELIFRFPRRPEIEAGLEKEILLLPALAPTLPVGVPHFEFIWRGGDGYDRPFVGYRKIQGVPLPTICRASAQSEHLAQQTATFLSELHRFPTQQAARLQVPGGSPDQWRQRYQDLYAWIREHAFPLLEAPTQAKTAALCESFSTNDANFQFRPVLIHGDLAGEHIFCDADTGAIRGVIDWEDATIGDPALDFVGLLCDAGPDFTRQVLAGYRGELDDAVEQRMVFYSRIGPLYEIQFGLATGDKVHLDQGLELLRSELQSV